MLRGFFAKLWEAHVAALLIGVCGFVFFGYAQENYYGNPNFLKTVEEMLGNQTSATTYFVVLYLSAAWILLYLGISTLIGFLKTRHGILGLYLWPLIPLVIYNLYEYQQMLHPTYSDNHVLDMVLSVLATITLWVITAIRIKTIKEE